MAYFAASADDAETNRKFAESLGLDYPMLADADGAVAKAYGVVGGGRPWPQRWTFYIGKDGKILAIDKAVRVETSAEDMVAKLGELNVARAKSN